MHRFRSSCTYAQYHLGLCSPFIHSEVSNDFVSGKWRSWSDCADTRRHIFTWHGPYDYMSEKTFADRVYKIYQYGLTHCSPDTPKRVIGKQCKPRCLIRVSTVCKWFSHLSEGISKSHSWMYLNLKLDSSKKQYGRIYSVCNGLSTLFVPYSSCVIFQNLSDVFVSFSPIHPAGLSGSVWHASDRWSGGCHLSPCWVQQHSFVDMITKYFLQSFSLLCWFKKGSCQFLAKECAQELVNCLED